jgi:hypothetical protein
VARMNPRLTAGVGVVSAFLLLGGPSVPAALADPGDSHSDRDSTSGRDGGYGRGGSDGDDGAGRRSAGSFETRPGDEPATRDIVESPRVRVGSGREDTQQLVPSVEPPLRGRSGSDHPGAPKAGFDRPRVTVGNGRSPGIQSGKPEPRWQAPAPEPAPAPPPPPPPPPPPAPKWVERIYTPPVISKQLGVAPASDWSGPLWGIAGLLLIPAAGAVLGYRQARAAQFAERLGRP